MSYELVIIAWMIAGWYGIKKLYEVDGDTMREAPCGVLLVFYLLLIILGPISILFAAGINELKHFND